ncbi:hypothetical protein [Streptomyces kaempferi]|jgi:hypothetical protein|uniref:Transmembrane protein n=1 Tax=Streptomyces kaempferi TaxID=333725 RepID=A0ABW3XH33_9ACTN
MADSFMQQLIASLARRTPVLDESVSYRPDSPETKGHSHSPHPAEPVLLAEDRPDFERTLDEALIEEAPGATERLNAEQLRTMAVTAREAIAARAAPEYAHYVEVRERARNLSGSEALHEDPDPAEASGAGAAAVVAVLAPVLSGTAAVISLLVGYVLGMMSPKPAFASALLNMGWVFTAITAAAVLAGLVGLLLTALRDGSVSQSHVGSAWNEEVAAARDAWRQAIRRRGIEPFLRDVRKAVSRGLDHD